MSKSLSLKHWIDRITTGIGNGSAWLLLLMVLIGAWNVGGRYLGRWIGVNLSANTLLELQWQLFSAVFLLGAANTLRRDQHVRVDVFYKDFSKRKQAIATLMGTFCFLFPFCGTVLAVSWRSVWNSCAIGEVSPNPGGLPLCPVKTLIPIGFILLLLQGLSIAISQWQLLRQPQQPQEASHE